MSIRLKALPPEKAIEFFRQKGFKIGFDYRDVWQAEHQAAFTVAKAMQMDLLRDIREQVDAALELGLPFSEFRDTLKPNLVRRGWWGKADMRDPATGEVKTVQLGSTRRLKVIYDTNLRTAHTEGQWARVQEAKDGLPFLMYDHTPSAYERKEHAAWDGLVFRVDDPWVLAHYPVKAFGCKCRMVQLGQRQLDRMGKKVGPVPAEKYVDHVNTRTGEKSRVPSGVDPAFNYPPGGRRASLVQHLAEQVSRVPEDIRSAASRAVTRQAFESWISKPAGDFPLAILPRKIVKSLGSSTDIVKVKPSMAIDNPGLSVSDYVSLQDAIDGGAFYVEGDGVARLLIERSGGSTEWRLNKSGRAVFLSSIRKLSND